MTHDFVPVKPVLIGVQPPMPEELATVPPTSSVDVLVVRYEDMRARPEQTLAEIVAFVGTFLATVLPVRVVPMIVRLEGNPKLGAYSASKAAVIGLTKSLGKELVQRGDITVNAICRGPILTGMTGAIPPEHRERFARRRTALRRYAEPEEVAHATLGLVLPAAGFITGATLLVDGGVTIRNA